jgi:hypothetical protein
VNSAKPVASDARKNLATNTATSTAATSIA